VQRDAIAAALTPVVEGIEMLDATDDPELAGNIDPLLDPSDDNVRSLYWRKKTPTPVDMDPNRDRCGAHWICLALPFDGSPAAEALGLAQALVLDAGFEPIIGFHTHNGRCLFGYIVLVYDREVAGEDERALACHDRLIAALAARGVEPYRLGIQSMGRLAAGDEAHTDVLRRLKALFDPDRILAPGRYDCSGNP
jgi:4-cresol dehydrogenase (hydroxylating)